MSIQRRLLSLMILVLLITSSTTYVVSYWSARHEMGELFDAELAQTARLLQSTYGPIIQSNVNIAASFPLEVDTKVGHYYERKVLFQVQQSGEVVFESAQSSLKLEQLPAPGFSNIRVDGYVWHLFVLPDGDVNYIVGERADIRAELAEDMLAGYLIPLTVGLSIMLLLAFWVVKKGLLPLQQLASQIEERSVENLNSIESEDIPTEMLPVVQSLNALLNTLRNSIELERRFTAMASHEMRTPISVLKVNLQNALRATDEDERQQYLLDLEKGIDRASRLMEQLLTLNKLEESTLHYEARSLDVLPIVREQIAGLYVLADSKQLKVALVHNQSKIIVETVPQLLTLVLRNLIENAIKYARSEVEVAVNVNEAGQVVLSVEDDGKGIPAEERIAVLKPFVRLVGTNAAGSGLGLAIVQRSVDLLKIDFRMKSGQRMSGLRVELVF